MLCTVKIDSDTLLISTSRIKKQHPFFRILQTVILKRAVQILNRNLQKFTSCPERTLRPAKARFFSLHTLCQEVNDVFGHPVFYTRSAACLDVTYCLFASCKGGAENSIAVDVLWAVLSLAPEVTVMILCQQVENAVSSSYFLAILC